MELPAIESESLVYKMVFASRGIPSTTVHIHCGNPGEPSSKTKYETKTDSELVPWGKGEKKGGTPSEIEPETVCGQTERARA